MRERRHVGMSNITAKELHRFGHEKLAVEKDSQKVWTVLPRLVTNLLWKLLLSPANARRQNAVPITHPRVVDISHGGQLGLRRDSDKGPGYSSFTKCGINSYINYVVGFQN